MAYPLPLLLASYKPANQRAASYMAERFLQQLLTRLSPTAHERLKVTRPHRATACKEHLTGCSCMMSTKRTSWIHHVDLLVRTGPEGSIPPGRSLRTCWSLLAPVTMSPGRSFETCWSTQAPATVSLGRSFETCWSGASGPSRLRCWGHSLKTCWSPDGGHDGHN